MKANDFIPLLGAPADDPGVTKLLAQMELGFRTAGELDVSACRAPTQARLVLTTDIDCALRPFAVFVERAPAAAERRATLQIVAARCTPDGYVGETYLLPADDGDLTLGLRAVAAPQSMLDSCSRATGYAGCIVARRRLSFLDGQTIVLAGGAPLEKPDFSCACAKEGT